MEEESGNHREKSVDICVTIITTCGSADNVYTDNEMGVGIGIVSNARPSRFDSRAGKSIVFLRDKHLPPYGAGDAASYGESRPPRHIN